MSKEFPYKNEEPSPVELELLRQPFFDYPNYIWSIASHFRTTCHNDILEFQQYIKENPLPTLEELCGEESYQNLIRFVGERTDALNTVIQEINQATNPTDFKRLVNKALFIVYPKKGVAQEFEEYENESKKDTYESLVTTKYFENWDALELDGNPHIKDRIKENIIQTEKLQQETYENAVNEDENSQFSIEEFKRKLQEKVEDMVRQSEFFIATDFNFMNQIFEDGRWKSQFEANQVKSLFNLHYRAEQEMKMFGFNAIEEGLIPTDWYKPCTGYFDGTKKFPMEILENDRELRPIYGYFTNDENGGIKSSVDMKQRLTTTNLYGKINIKIQKERALKKATLSFHDSLGSQWSPTPAAKPHFTSFPLPYHNGGKILQNLKETRFVNWGQHRYTEAQYHGQLTIDDIESIHVSISNGLTQQNIKEIREILSKYKIAHPNSNIQLIEY